MACKRIYIYTKDAVKELEKIVECLTNLENSEDQSVFKRISACDSKLDVCEDVPYYTVRLEYTGQEYNDRVELLLQAYAKYVPAYINEKTFEDRNTTSHTILVSPHFCGKQYLESEAEDNILNDVVRKFDTFLELHFPELREKEIV